MSRSRISPSFITGFHLAARLHKLVALVWLGSMVAFLPALTIIHMAVGSSRADLPAAGLGSGEDLVVFVEMMRPLLLPLAIAFGFGCLVFVAWWILWHAGTVRWWMDADITRVRLAEMVGDGIEVWWRYARLAMVTIVLQAMTVILPWLALRVDVGDRWLPLVLIAAIVLTIDATAIVWLAALRGGWWLGEADRRSAVVAWLRGLWSVFRQPLRSFLPLVVWALPGFALFLLPVYYDGPAAILFLLAAWLVSAFCWVALYLSFAPPEPPPVREVSPLDPPGQFATTFFPTLHDDR